MKKDMLIHITGFWKNESRDGSTYYASKLKSGAKLLLFENRHKRSGKDPDLILCISASDNSRDPHDKEAEYL